MQSRSLSSPPYTSPPRLPAEVILLIFTYLNGYDLDRTSLVCKRWRNLAFSCYDVPTPCFEELEPHFDRPCKAYKEQESAFDKLQVNLSGSDNNPVSNIVAQDIAIIAPSNESYTGVPVLRAMREIDIEILVNVYDDQPTGWEVYPPEYKPVRIRAAFQGVRFPHGWPAGLREIHCEICNKFHTSFRFQNLHPGLRFLEDMTICFRGHGSRLRLQIGTIAEHRAPKSCFEHYVDEMVRFAHGLREATASTAADANQFATRPLITKLVTRAGPRINEDFEYYSVVEDVEGLILKSVVQFLIKAFRDHLKNYNLLLRRGEATLGENPPQEEPHLIAAFSGAQWTAHKAQFGDVLGVFRSGLVAVNVIMNGVQEWEPIILEDMQDV
ncbi:Nn.00g081090.m01.CDS01 [Neocucurbitaria sp. VM-36]